MRIFEYPYVIITLLSIGFLIMALVGIYFSIKSVKTANGTNGEEEKSFCKTGRIESDFEKAGNMRQKRCLVYVSVSLDSLKRIYPESKAMRILEKIKKVMLTHFCINIKGNISPYEKNNFVAVNYCDEDEIIVHIKECFKEVSKILEDNAAVNILRINFGYYCTTSTEVSFKTALERAKQAATMAEDKEILHCGWDSDNGKKFEKKIKIESNINSEIENNSFFLEYQPIVDAKTNKIVGAEVLSRLNSRTDGILTPHAFLSAVNNVGLNKKFDYYIFEKNCKWISNDKDNRTNYIYTINFSRDTLCDSKFVKNITEIINKYSLQYSCIAVEILEDKNLEKEEKRIMSENLNALREKGVSIFLDDFGKGYTSFGDLTEFDINVVKIDKSITQNAITKPGFLILKNIIKVAQELGFKTLCEGIETEEQKRVVTDAGGDMLQGFYFYRPMPVTQLEKIFEDN